MDTATRVWVPQEAGDTNQVQWVAAEITQQDTQGTGRCTCMTSTGQELEVASDSIEMREVLPDDGMDDLTKLSYLHEPAILDNLLVRFNAAKGQGRARKQIYTYCGHICIAVNPFEWLHELYTTEIIERFRGSLSFEENEPHVYAVAEAAFSSMMTGVKDGIGNQSVLVSGESGAGKTETVKIMMNYLAEAAGKKKADGGAAAAAAAGGGVGGFSDVASAVISSNPLLEAFGNARTLRNDNSSRFGKFTQILFDNGGSIVGSRVDVYLLEKSRVVNQTVGERSYHIFYQLLCAPESRIDTTIRKQCQLLDPDGYEYLNQSGCTTIDGLSDTDEFMTVAESMDVVGLPMEEQVHIARTVAAVLSIGHIRFSEEMGGSGEMQSAVEGGTQALWLQASLLSCGEEDLSSALISRQICARDEWYTIQLTKVQSDDSRDGLAKALYARLFDWMVSRINMSTAPENPKQVNSSIGILDIFGFESFKDNSFEQLLINFANEKLQQQFTWYVFKLEQEEYNREGIVWNSVDFQDNQPVLDTIEGYGGVLPLLDEECFIQRGSDENFMLKLKKTRIRKVSPTPGSKPESILSFPKLGQTHFIVRHYAGFVEYNSANFREKNKDSLHPDMVALMQSSAELFVAALFPAAPEGQVKRGGKLPTLGSQFKNSLNSLLDGINKTAVHYVRCIKPNQTASAKDFDLDGVQDQLRCQGILEAIRIARAAYPNRLPHADLVSRYLMCLRDEVLALPGAAVLSETMSSIRDTKVQAQKMMGALNLDTELFQIGKTKVFFRRVALEQLEASRGRVIDVKLVRLQAAVRAMLGVKKYASMKAAAVVMQACGRAFVGRNRYQNQRQAAIKIQSWGRVYNARLELYQRRYGAAATVIQTAWRRAVAQKYYSRLRPATVVCQREARRAIAVRRYPRLLHQAKEDAKLQNIVNNLQERLADEMQQRAAAEDKAAEEAVAVKKGAADVAALAEKRAADAEARVVELAAAMEAVTVRTRERSDSALAAEDGAHSEESREIISGLEEQVHNLQIQLGVANNRISMLESEAVAAASSLPESSGDNSKLVKTLREQLQTVNEKWMNAQANAISGGESEAAEATKSLVASAVAEAEALLREQLGVQSEELAATKESLASATKTFHDMEADLQSKSERLAEHQTEGERLSQERNRVQESLSSCLAKLAATEAMVSGGGSNSAGVIAAAVEAAQSAAKDEMKEMQQQLASKNTMLESAQKELESAQRRLDSASATDTVQVVNKQIFTQQKSALTDRLAMFDKQFKSKQSASDTVRDENISLLSKVATLQAELATYRSEGRLDDAGGRETASAAIEEVKLKFEKHLQDQREQLIESKQEAQAAAERLVEQEAAERLRTDNLESMLKTQQAEMAHLYKEQAESHEKLLNSSSGGGGGTAEDGAGVTDDEIDSYIVQMKRQLDVKDAELKGAIAGAAFATEQLRDRKEADKLVITARDTEVKQLAALNEQCGMQTDEILRLRTQIAEISEQLTGAKIEVAVLQQKGGTADSASDMATDAAKIAVEAGMAVLKQQLDATQEELASSRQFGQEVMTNLNRLSSMEKDRSSQQDKQSQNQAADFQRMISTLDDREKSIQGLAAEVAATKLAATGNASAEDLIQSAVMAAKDAMTSEVDPKVLQLESQLRAKDAQLVALTTSASFSEKNLRADTSMASERFKVLDEQLERTRSSLDASQSETNEMRSKLVTAEKDLAQTRSVMQKVMSRSALGAAVRPAATADQDALRLSAEDDKVVSLEKLVEAKDAELREARERAAATTKSLQKLEQQDTARSEELLQQLESQQNELQALRSEQVSNSTKLAIALGQVAAVTKAARDPAAVLQVVEAARSAATAAAAEENSKYEVQIKDLAAQLQVKETALRIMKMKVEKRADTVADRLHKDMAEVKDQVITERTEQMEEQAAGQQAENDRLSAELAEMTKQFETVRDEVDLAMMTKTPIDISDDVLLQTFNRIDADHSGRLDREEVRIYTAELGWELTEEEVERAIEHMDTDEKGTVSYAGFVEWWRSGANSAIAEKFKQKILKEARRISTDAADGAERTRMVQLEQQLEFTRAELHVEKQRAEKLQGRLKLVGKMEDDVLLLTSSPLAGGRTTVQELELANKQISEKNLKIVQLEKKELQEALARDQQRKKVSDLQEALQTAKVQVRKFAEQTMTLMQDIKALEDGFGVASRSKKMSSSEIHKRLVGLVGILAMRSKRQSAMREVAVELVNLQRRLQEACLESLYKAAGTMMDQKDMLRLSNSKIKAIQTRSRHLKAEVDELRKNFCRDLALEGAHHEVIGGAVPETFDGSEVVSAADYQALGLAGGLLDSIVDAGKLRADLNSLTWELCKPQYNPAEVRAFEEQQGGEQRGAREQAPKFYNSFRQPVPSSPAPVSSGARQLDQLVQLELNKSIESRKSGAQVHNMLEPEPDGLLRYIRACYQNADQSDLQLMCKELTSLLGMFQATGKLETTDWDAFPAPF